MTISLSRTIKPGQNTAIACVDLSHNSAISTTTVAHSQVLVVFDPRVSDLDLLHAALVPGAIAHTIDASQDALPVITQLLAETGATQLAIVAHGEPGVVHIGATLLTLEQLQTHAYLLQEWGVKEVALYSCEVAKGDRGEQFIHWLSKLTGAAVAASSTKVGNSALGGNWELDVEAGVPFLPLAFLSTVMEQYKGTFSPEPVQYDINLGPGSSSPSNLTNVNGTLYFSAFNSTNGRELWKLDPATGTPVLVADIEAGTGSSNPIFLTNVNGTLYFRAFNSANGTELWKLDPATATPVLVADIQAGTSSSNPSNLTNVNGTLYFSAFNSTNGRELWKLDPATATPVLVADIEAGPGASNPSNLTNVNGTFYFSAFNSDNGYELWKLDPATATPVLVADIEASTGSSNPINLTNVNGTLYFSAFNSANGTELWKLDPATGTPVLVADIEASTGSSNPGNLTNVNGTLYFSAFNSANGTELWKIDPATGTPVLAADIQAGMGSSSPRNLTNVNGTLYFHAFNSTNGSELWKLDPAIGTPVLVADIEAGTGSSFPVNLTNVNGTLYFSAFNSTNGIELWRINPDTNAPELVVDFNPGASSSTPAILGFENGKLYLSADNGVNGRELWTLDVVNDVPILSNISKLGNEDTTTTFTLGDFTTAFNDADGDSLSKIKITALPTGGVLMLGNNAVTLNQEIAAADLNTLKFVPAADFNGTVSFSWNGFDGTTYATTPATVTLTIDNLNDAPALTGAQASLAPGTEDVAYVITAASLLQGYSDVDGDALSVTGLTATNGSLVENEDGTYTFTPDANFNGTVNLTYNVVDGKGGSVGATQDFTIDAVNDAPIGNATKVLDAGAEDTPYIIDPSDLIVGFTDADGDALSVTDLTATNGSLAENEDSTYTFTPDANFNGTVNLTYNVVDGKGGSVGATQDFTIDAVNDAPIGNATKVLDAGAEDTPYIIDPSDLIVGFTDADGDALSVTDLTATNGSLAENEDGTYTFTPTANFNGTVNLTYNVVDGKGGSVGATQDFTIDAVNDAPIGNATKVLDAGAEDTAYIIDPSDLLVGFTDADGDALSITGLTATNGSLVENKNGTYTLTPNVNFNGLVNLTYNVADGKGGLVGATQSFTIAGLNDAPVGTATKALDAGAEDTAYIIDPSDLLVGFTDADGDALSITGLTATNGSLVENEDGTYTFTPTANFNGTVNLTYNVVDGKGDSVGTTQSFTIAAVNDAPTVANLIADQTATQGALFTFMVPDGTFDDVEGDRLAYTATLADGSSLPSWLGFDANTRTFSGTPTANLVGNLSIKVTATDAAGAAVSDVFTITFVNANGTTISGVDTNGNLFGNLYGAGQPYTGDLLTNTDGTDNPDDVVVGTPGNDNIWVGAEGNDQVDAGEGNNFIGIGTGNSTVTAGSGDDFIYSVAGGGTNIIDLGDGNNHAWLGRGNHTITTGSGDDLIGVGAGDNIINTNGGDDFVYSNGDISGSTNVINLGGGNNQVWLTGGNNTITAGNGNNFIGIGTGNSTVTVGAGDDSIYSINGGGGINILDLGDGNNHAWLGRGNHTITTGSGDDLIGVGAGDNIINTNGGDDFVYSNGDMSDSTNVINLGGGNNQVWLTGGNNTITAGSGDDVVGLGNGSDRVDLGDGNNIVYMADPNGTADGNKDIITGMGNDWVQTGSGNDRLNLGTHAGGKGDFDIAFGGSGNDTFVLNGSSGLLTVGDFIQGEDQLEISGISVSDIDTTKDIGRNSTWVWTNSGDVLAELQGFTGTLSASDFVAV